MASSLLSRTSSKDQLKRQGTKEGLLSFCRPGTIKSKAVLFKSKTTEHVQSVIKAKEMTFNFYVKAENLQIQGKENANQLRVELVNLARTKNLNDSVAPVTKNKMNKMALKLPAPATMKAMKKTTP